MRAVPMITLVEWVRERLENCNRIAATKTGVEREGWEEDARYFRLILNIVQEWRGQAAFFDETAARD